jgi:lipopolysaccharide transport system ATP-binding protein
MRPILEIQNISKRFSIQHEGQSYLSFRDRLINIFKSSTTKEEFWALKDVSFSVGAGESIGIIGRNGAGKSTLLKVLSKITPPTKGRIICRGRIASLLEVGTGFHPELTGRENIFLNGSILGMKHTEISKRFDEIVDFAGTEKFLDTPLKHYSSGMQLRLAFAVAAFLEPEILIIDEVLAVGDAEFQKKCIGKMEDVRRDGRTLLFVSHNLIAVENLCPKSILLNAGSIEGVGDSREIVKTYLSKKPGTGPLPSESQFQSVSKQGTGKIKFRNIAIKTVQDGEVAVGDKVEFILGLTNYQLEPGKSFYLAITIFNQHGIKLTTLDNFISEEPVIVRKGDFSVRCVLPSIQLMPADYRIDLWCADAHETFDLREDVYTLSVKPANIFGTGKIHDEARHGNFIVENHWLND